MLRYQREKRGRFYPFAANMALKQTNTFTGSIGFIYNAVIKCQELKNTECYLMTFAVTETEKQ
jgi:hypothetical protein